MKGATPTRRSKTAVAAVLLTALILPAITQQCIWPEQARLFVAYLKATGCSEEPMTWMERVAVSYLMAGQKAQKAKEASAKPASVRQSS